LRRPCEDSVFSILLGLIFSIVLGLLLCSSEKKAGSHALTPLKKHAPFHHDQEQLGPKKRSSQGDSTLYSA
jgi:hypothetical protein